MKAIKRSFRRKPKASTQRSSRSKSSNAFVASEPVFPTFNSLSRKIQMCFSDKNSRFVDDYVVCEHTTRPINPHQIAAEIRRISLLQHLMGLLRCTEDIVIHDIFGSLRTYQMLVDLVKSTKFKYKVTYVLHYGLIVPKDGSRYIAVPYFVPDASVAFVSKQIVALNQVTRIDLVRLQVALLQDVYELKLAPNDTVTNLCVLHIDWLRKVFEEVAFIGFFYNQKVKNTYMVYKNLVAMVSKDGKVCYFPSYSDPFNYYIHSCPDINVYLNAASVFTYGPYGVFKYFPGDFRSGFSFSSLDNYYVTYGLIPFVRSVLSEVTVSAQVLQVINYLDTVSRAMVKQPKYESLTCLHVCAPAEFQVYLLEDQREFLQIQHASRSREVQAYASVIIQNNNNSVTTADVSGRATSFIMPYLNFIKTHIEKIGSLFAVTGIAITAIVTIPKLIPMGASILSSIAYLAGATNPVMIYMTLIDPFLEEGLRVIFPELLQNHCSKHVVNLVVLAILVAIEIVLGILINPLSIPMRVLTHVLMSLDLGITTAKGTASSMSVPFRAVCHLILNAATLAPLPISIIVYVVLYVIILGVVSWRHDLYSNLVQFLEKKIDDYAHKHTDCDFSSYWLLRKVITCAPDFVFEYVTEPFQYLTKPMFEKVTSFFKVDVTPCPEIEEPLMLHQSKETMEYPIYIPSEILKSPDFYLSSPDMVEMQNCISQSFKLVDEFKNNGTIEGRPLSSFFSTSQLQLLEELKNPTVVDKEEEYIEEPLIIDAKPVKEMESGVSEINLFPEPIPEIVNAINDENNVVVSEPVNTVEDEKNSIVPSGCAFEDRTLDDPEVLAYEDRSEVLVIQGFLSAAVAVKAIEAELKSLNVLPPVEDSIVFNNVEVPPPVASTSISTGLKTDILDEDFETIPIFSVRNAEIFNFVVPCVLPPTKPSLDLVGLLDMYQECIDFPKPLLFKMFGFQIRSEILTPLIDHLKNSFQLQETYAQTKYLNDHPSLVTHVSTALYAIPRVCHDYATYTTMYRIIAPNPTYSKAYSMMFNYHKDLRNTQFAYFNQVADQHLSARSKFVKRLERNVLAGLDKFVVNDSTNIVFIEQLKQYIKDRPITATARSLYETAMSDFIFKEDTDIVLDNLMLKEQKTRYTDMIAKQNEKLLKLMAQTIQQAFSWYLPDELNRPEIIPRAVASVDKEPVMLMTGITAEVKRIYLENQQELTNNFRVVKKDKVNFGIYKLYCSGLTHSEIAELVNDCVYEENPMLVDNIDFVIVIGAAGDDGTIQVYGNSGHSFEFLFGYSPDAEKYDASQDISVMNLEAEIFAKLTSKAFGLSRDEILNVMAYCYTRPMMLPSPDSTLFIMKKIMMLSGASYTSVGNTVAMLAFLEHIIVAAIMSINMKQYQSKYPDGTIVDCLMDAIRQQFVVGSEVIKFTNTEPVKTLEELTFLRCYFTNISGRIELVASYGLFFKAMSVIVDYKKYADLDVFNPEHVLAYRKVVLSSLLALPHHGDFDTLTYYLDGVSDIDLSNQSAGKPKYLEQIVAELETSFYHKVLVEWGSKSKIVDNKSDVLRNRYNMSQTDMAYVLDAYLLPAVQDDPTFADLLGRILAVDYGL